MAIKSSEYFNLDSNIDGFYVDEDGNVNIVDNMIGVVGATDGAPASPETAAKGAPLSSDTIDSLVSQGLNPAKIRSLLGHGLVYDDKGNHIANKGEMFFRDGQGNFSTLKKLTGQTNLILEEGSDLKLRDYSLVDKGYTNTAGISLDELMKYANLKTTNFSKGNILQLSRNYEIAGDTVSVPTVSLTEDAVVWAVGRIMARGSGEVRLRHLESDTVLDTGYFSFPSKFVMPCYISWIGNLEQYPETQSQYSKRCVDTTWDVKTKSFKRIYNPSGALVQPHTLVLESLDTDFTYGYLNIMCMEPKTRQSADFKTGSVYMSSDNYAIIFDQAFEDDGYSINIQLESPLQSWYSKKTPNGFDINIDRAYEGKVTWSAIKSK